MPTYQCEYCGATASSVANLTRLPCFRHPSGPNRGKHKLYEGSTKTSYTCKYCGLSNHSLANLTSQDCYRHPNGPNRGKHAPAL